MAGGESEVITEVGGVAEALHLTSRVTKGFLTGPQEELEQCFL